MDEVRKNIVDGYLQPIAQRKYQEQLAEWEQQIELEERHNAERLRDPLFATGLGLPGELPQHTIDILKTTLALDKLGPTKPEISKVYGRYGL